MVQIRCKFARFQQKHQICGRSRPAPRHLAELRLLPSTGITRLHRYYGPLRHPNAPGLSLTGVRLIIPDHALGLPVLRALSLCTCCRHYPGAAAGCSLRSSHPTVSAFPGRGRRVGLHIDLFEACSAFTRVAACTLARSPIRDPLSEGFRHFVSSMPAPVASGWSESPGGACTRWKAPPCHGAHPKGSFAPGDPKNGSCPIPDLETGSGVGS